MTKRTSDRKRSGPCRMDFGRKICRLHPGKFAIYSITVDYQSFKPYPYASPYQSLSLFFISDCSDPL